MIPTQDNNSHSMSSARMSLKQLEDKISEEQKKRDKEVWENKRCHEKLDYYLHKHSVEYIFVFLIILDALIVVASLLLEIRLAEGGGNHEVEQAAEGLHATSLFILSIFMVEVFLKLYAQREKFFHHKLQIVDGFVVAISFALDIAEVVIKQSTAPEILSGLSLLIILRLWRLVRIVNSAVLATKERLAEQIHHLKRQNMIFQEANIELEDKLNSKQEEILFLKSRLSKYEPVDMIPNGSTRLPAYLPETNAFPAQVLGDLADDDEYNMADMRNVRVSLGNHGQASAFRTNQEFDNMASESDVMSVPTPKSRSGNTFTVKKRDYF